MPDHPTSRCLTLDLRTRRYGYAAFDGPRRLLGWGFRKHPRSREMAVHRHLTALQSRYRFGQILARRRVIAKTENLQPELVRKVLQFALSAQIPITFIDADKIRRFFNGKPKYEIAKLVAFRFPEIAWKLPSKRKAWEPESERQSVFDAMSVGLYFFESQIRPGHEDRSEFV